MSLIAPRLTAFASGLLFGLGLIVSGMADPAKVLGFLDLAGAWDPSLALVMAGAVAVGLLGFSLANRRKRTLFTGEPLHLPGAGRIDRRILLGSAAFGTGWGLAGICPGPALVIAVLAPMQAWPFVLAMLTGFALYAWLERRRG
ncbi:YeeE/YedE family protein [Chitiniphilus purpureus]|uniref:YeeE/YedE family protein n=1 Tax=Chitiniphilus purpureus TaxID=2981137 RepID=A0ABY6DJB3_9NEIS|nr:YeeE/YedE family protein [Chitiniphilus sp. CD1]UXY14435.1 YeeE/YedE family protein [Chitiniphilus sp. CD1]